MINSLIKGKTKLNIGFSGGEDSIFAAHLLSKRHKVTLFHYNHRLLDSDNEICERAVDSAFQLGLPIVVGTNKDETYKKGSKEDFCRQLRYRWFSNLGGTLVTGHHLGDSTEGYFLNCLRGHPEYLPIPISSVFGETLVVRPFLLTPKKVIRDYLSKFTLNHLVVEDPLNQSVAQTRNWLRLSILPQIKERTNVEKVVKKRYLEYLKKNPLTKPKIGI